MYMHVYSIHAGLPKGNGSNITRDWVTWWDTNESYDFEAQYVLELLVLMHGKQRVSGSSTWQLIDLCNQNQIAHGW